MRARSCNGCTVCCGVFGVEEIGKMPWSPCPNLGNAGCSVYMRRPKMCREFYCEWQGGLGDSKDRPDWLGVIFAKTNGPTEFTGEVEFQAYEVVPGAFKRVRVVDVAKALVRGTTKLIVGHCHGGQVLMFMGPPEKIEAAQKWVATRGGGDVPGDGHGR